MKKPGQSIAFKSIFSIVLILIVFFAIVSAIGYKGFTDALLAQYSEGAFRTADAAAVFLDADKMDDYLASGGTTYDYRIVLKRLDQICNTTGATFVYVIQPDRTDYGHITFLFSTINHDSDYTLYDFGYVRETTNDEYREKYRALYEGESERELVIRDKGYIETDPHITAMIPLKGEDGLTKAILCVQRQMDAMAAARNAYLRRVTLVLLVLSLLAIIGQGMYLHRMLIQPVQQISDEARRFARENVTTGRKLRETIKNKDEIGLLAGSIDRMEEQIHSYVQDLTRITAERERFTTEMALATRIQKDMLPSVFPPFPERTEFDIYASMASAREVSGDFYDFFLIDDDHLCLVVADVAGKGVPAALFMMAVKILLASNAKQGGSPAEIFESVNASICANNQEEMFVTVWLGILEISTGKLRAANAGHEYPVLKDQGGKFELFKDTHSFVIGSIEGTVYREYELQLKPGSKLFLYTDGVPEATDSEGRMFGVERMLATLNENADAEPEELLAKVKQAAEAFRGQAEQFDDLTMMCLKYEGQDNGK